MNKNEIFQAIIGWWGNMRLPHHSSVFFLSPTLITKCNFSISQPYSGEESQMFSLFSGSIFEWLSHSPSFVVSHSIFLLRVMAKPKGLLKDANGGRIWFQYLLLLFVPSHFDVLRLNEERENCNFFSSSAEASMEHKEKLTSGTPRA